MEYQKSKLVIIVFLILIIYLLYNKKCENFTNLIHNSNKYLGYNNLTDNSSPYYGYQQEEITELERILKKIILEINIQSNSNFYLGNIENITMTQQPNNKLNYVVDVFLFEKDKDYTLRCMMNFIVNTNKQIEIISITRGNAFKYDFNNSKVEKHPHVFEKRISNVSDFKNKYTIKGINDSSLHFSLTKDLNLNLGLKENPKPLEHNKDILPLSVEQDSYYKHEQNKNFIYQNVYDEKKPNCWDCNGIKKENPHHSTCNIFEREQEPLLDSMQPRFNSSIHKNITDKKENEWLFSPTRMEIDHNL